MPMSILRNNTVRKAKIAMRIDAEKVPRRRALSNAPISGFSPTLTRNMPIMEAIMPPAAISMGRNQAVAISGTSDLPRTTEEAAIIPRVMVAIMESTYDSNRSAPMPAVSPTLSPTKSAITAAFLGSSSGIPCSTFPTISAPVSAALVYIPPPTLANIATEEAPKPKPGIMNRKLGLLPYMKKRILKPMIPMPTTVIPITAPARKETRRPWFRLFWAAAAVRPLALIAMLIPM